MVRTIRPLRELFARLPSDGKVRHELRRFNLQMTGGKPPSAKGLAEALGLDVYLVDLPAACRGRLEVDTFAESGFRIEINRRDGVRVRRWTVLHEVMHFLLHRRDDPFAPSLHRAGLGHFYDQGELIEEREANTFVEARVFGDGALEGAVGLFGKDIGRLAAHFGVTTLAVEIALKKL